MNEVQINETTVVSTNEEVKVRLALTDNGKVIQSIENARIVIEYDHQLKGKLRYNILSFSTWVFGDLPWDKSDNYREWSNTDDSNLLCYMEKVYGINNSEKIMHALTITTYNNKFNPVTDFLESLVWDGKPHIENLLPDYLGVDKNEYSIEAMKIFMLGAISRAYHPGSKFDFMPVMVGGQGIGKSTFLRILSCNDEWFSDNFNTVDGDRATERLRGMWIVELAELLAVKRSQDIEGIKSFLTSTADVYRPPYGRRTEQRPRRCVFAGSTNNTHFLTDRTGNRRYLPLLANKDCVKKSMFENANVVMEDFRQAWAEAMVIYKSGKFSLEFPEHLKEYVNSVQEEYLEEDTRVGIIQEFLDQLNDNEVCIAQIYREALHEQGNPSRRESNDLHDIMQSSIKGWIKIDRKKRIGSYGPQIGYHRIKEQGFVQMPKNIDVPFD